MYLFTSSSSWMGSCVQEHTDLGPPAEPAPEPGGGSLGRSPGSGPLMRPPGWQAALPLCLFLPAVREVGGVGRLPIPWFLLLCLTSFLCAWRLQNGHILLVSKLCLCDFVESVSVVLMSLTEATQLGCGALKNGISSGRISGPATSLLCPVPSWTAVKSCICGRLSVTLKGSSEI